MSDNNTEQKDIKPFITILFEFIICFRIEMDAHTQVAVSQPCFSGDGQDISELDFDLLVDYLFNEPGQDSRNENSLSDDDNEGDHVG